MRGGALLAVGFEGFVLGNPAMMDGAVVIGVNDMVNPAAGKG